MPFPRSDLDLVTTLPKNFAFKTPEPEDIDEEGFGFFRGVWPIVGGSLDYARELAARERELADIVATIATDEAEFDLIASDVEVFDPEENEEEFFSFIEPRDAGRLKSSLYDAPLLDGLELGVAGLVTALAAVGTYPAASCRGHVGPQAWATYPTVFFASDLQLALALEPLVAESGCGFRDGSANGESLMIIESQSLVEAMQLTERILASEQAFKQ